MDESKIESWYLVRKDGRIQLLMQGMMFVGREECDIILQSASADKRHAVVFFDSSNKEIHIKDLNSLTGTYVNGMRIPEQSYVKLKDSDSLRFGYGPDMFHIQKHNGSTSFSPPYKNVLRRTQPLFSEKPELIKENHSCPAENRMPAEIVHKALASNKKSDEYRVERLQEADSLEDLKQVQDSGDKSGELQTQDHTKVFIPVNNTRTFKRNNGNHNTNVESLQSLAITPENSLPNKSSNTSETLKSPLESVSDSVASAPGTIQITNSENQLDKEEEEEETSPFAMAFTVAFDNPTPKKRFNIRDSISKYAPRKTDVERNTSRPKQEKISEPFSKKTIIPETKKDSQVELRKKKSPGERTIEDVEDGWKMGNQNNVNKAAEPKLSNGATYLIQKMFKSEKSHKSNQEPLPNPSQPVANCQKKIQSKQNIPNNSSPEIKVENVQVNDDNKSDTGTYTIEQELNDKAVKEHRQQIDVVFGLTSPTENPEKDSQIIPKDENITSNPPVAVQQKPVEQGDKPSHVEALSWCKSSDNIGVVPTRPKRRLPTPPVQASSLGSPDSFLDEKPNPSSYNTYSVKNRAQLMYSMPKRDIELRGHTPTYDKKPLPTKERLSPKLPNKNMSTTNRLTLNNLELLQNSCDSVKSRLFSDYQTEHSPQSKTPPAGLYWRRTPWNLSGSDMDLDQIRVETASVLSDVSASTEPPSMNCHTNGNRTDTGPQMKFNRAFALRRARLGLDTDMPGARKISLSKDSLLKQSKDGSSLTPAVSPLSRQDGGRFSLRLSKNSAKPVTNKSNTKTAVSKAPVANTGVKFGHRRTDSDSSKVGKSSSEVERPGRGNTGHQSFQRASSFSGNDEDTNAARYRQQKPVIRKPDNLTATFLKRMSRSVQIPAKSPETEVKSEHRASPLPKDKNELSALDNLVISAIHQLSIKLKTGAHRLLEKERDKFTEDSSERFMINEVLPHVVEDNPSNITIEGTITRDLSSILRNLQRVEKSLKVLTIVVDDDRMDSRKLQNHDLSATEDNYVVFNV